jgi:hypothetical protein
MLSFTVTMITINTVTVTSAATDTTIATARRPRCVGRGVAAAAVGAGDDGAREVHSSCCIVGTTPSSAATLLWLTTKAARSSTTIIGGGGAMAVELLYGKELGRRMARRCRERSHSLSVVETIIICI